MTIQTSPAVDDAFAKSSLNTLREHGDSLREAGKYQESLEIYEKILKLHPEDYPALFGRCQTLQRAGRQEDALACIWQILGTAQRSASLWLEAATILFNLNRLDEARPALHNALKLDRNFPRAWGMLGEILAKRSKNAAAEACFRRNSTLAPNDALVRLRLAQWLTQDARFDEAIEFFEDVRRLAPDSLDAVSGLAQVYISLGRLEEAEPMLQQVLQRDPKHLDACLGIARLLLLKGAFADGWPAYESRRRRHDFKLPKLPGREWDGTALSGKTIIVHAEQGFGDVIQFVRYMRLLNAEGARVILLVPKELEELCQCLAIYAEIRSSLKALPESDFHIPLLSLAWHLKIDESNISDQIPYLNVEPSSKLKLPIPLGTKLKVGLVWAGRPTHANNRHRSMSLESLMPLAAVPGVTLYALQAGPHAKDIHKEAHPVLVGDLSPYLKDFVDTARVIQQLDLVVAVDTSVAHLAGALGKPVWVLIPYAPDWRWLRNGAETPWYPTMRLFRQSEPRRWDDVVERVAIELGELAALHEDEEPGDDCTAHSVFPTPDGSPRYTLTAPRDFLTDAGIRYLFDKERKGVGYEYATRCFLDAHLQPGDLFIDVGAHWGTMSLHAATSCADIRVLACEPTPRNIPFLRRWVERNGQSDKIEIIDAAIADKPGRGCMLPQSTMGHSLQKAKGGLVEVTTIDRLLADRPDLAHRRVLIKIDVEGTEADVIKGMKKLLASGRVAAVIWERGRTYDRPEEKGAVASIRAHFDQLGYSSWRFDSEDSAEALKPFTDDGRIENVFELAASISPLPSYQSARLPKDRQPADPIAETIERASKLFQEGLNYQASGMIEKALSSYAVSGTLDRRSPDLFNNLGVALQRLGRLPAAEASYRRAIHLAPDNPGFLSNLGSVLREQGKYEQSVTLHALAVEKAPTNAAALSNAAHAHRDLGRLGEAHSLYEKSLALQSNNFDISLDSAKALLGQGDFKNGFRSYAMQRPTTKAASLSGSEWTGEPIKGRSILLLDDGDLDDALLFIRFVPDLVQKGPSKITISCRQSLAGLFATIEGLSILVANDAPSSECDFYASLAALPSLLGVVLERLEKQQFPYLGSTSSVSIPRSNDDPRPKVGLMWATTPYKRETSCPIELLTHLFKLPGFAIYSLQLGSNVSDLIMSGADEFVQDLSPRMTDYAAIASTLTNLDLVLTVDGPIAHIAGALAIPTMLMLPFAADWRWARDKRDTPWYPTVQIFRQTKPNDWESVIALVSEHMAKMSVGSSKIPKSRSAKNATRRRK